MNLQISLHFSLLDKLQNKYGNPDLHAIYGAGCTESPNVMLIFMNPTAKNISSNKNWEGIRAPWLGTKNIWKLLGDLKVLDSNLIKEITVVKPHNWTPDFAIYIYSTLAQKGIYITNLAKCTQSDARHVKNSIYKEYLNQTLEEIDYLKPSKIITFGGQVSTVLLSKAIKVSSYNNNEYELLRIKDNEYKVYPSYYPVGQGMRNIKKAKQRIQNIINLY